MRIHNRLLFLAASALCAITPGCDPDLQGGGYATPSVMVGYGNWSGGGVGFGAYSPDHPTGGILGGTNVCLYQDTNGDGKLTCGEVQACAKKLSGGPEKFVTGGATNSGGSVPPPGIICGEVKYRDKNGNDHEACVLVSTSPGANLDVCGLKDCCKCVDCEEPAQTQDQSEGGHALNAPATPQDGDQAPSGGSVYDWRGPTGQLEMRVTHDASGTSWTVLATSALQATQIDLIEVSSGGNVVQVITLPATWTPEGLLASYSGAVKSDHYTVFSARDSSGPLRNFFAIVTQRPEDMSTEEYLDFVYTSVFR